MRMFPKITILHQHVYVRYVLLQKIVVKLHSHKDLPWNFPVKNCGSRKKSQPVVSGDLVIFLNSHIEHINIHVNFSYNKFFFVI